MRLIYNLIQTFILSNILVFLVFSANAQSYIHINGRIIDAESKEGLPFATIQVQGTSLGAVSNLEGDFEIKMPASIENGKLTFNYMGYESSELIFSAKQGNQEQLEIALKPSLIELSEVVVHAITPEEYILRSMRKLKKNYANTFQSNAYYRQTSTDKGREVQFAEGYIQAYVPDFLNKGADIQQRLLLYTSRDKIDNLSLMRNKRERALKKEYKKANKEGREVNEDSIKNNIEGFSMDIISPDLILSEDPLRQVESFLDSTQFDAYSYQFGEDITYQGRKVMTINFSPLKKTHIQSSSMKGKLSGTLFYDYETDALIGIDYNSKMYLPGILKPVLFMAGYGFGEVSMQKQVRYILLNEKWYMRSIQLNLNVDMTKKYWFKENENSIINTEILMSLDNISENATEIPEKYRWDTSKSPESSVHPINGISWSNVNRIRVESIRNN